jgi:hypothetical protein
MVESDSVTRQIISDRNRVEAPHCRRVVCCYTVPPEAIHVDGVKPLPPWSTDLHRADVAFVAKRSIGVGDSESEKRRVYTPGQPSMIRWPRIPCICRPWRTVRHSRQLRQDPNVYKSPRFAGVRHGTESMNVDESGSRCTVDHLFVRTKTSRCFVDNMDLNRHQFLFIGLMVLMIGLQVRYVSAYVLNPEATRFLAEHTGQSNGATSSLFSATAGTGMGPRKVLQPPEWLSWCLMSVGAVLVLHSLAMPRPS